MKRMLLFGPLCFSLALFGMDKERISVSLYIAEQVAGLHFPQIGSRDHFATQDELDALLVYVLVIHGGDDGVERVRYEKLARMGAKFPKDKIKLSVYFLRALIDNAKWQKDLDMEAWYCLGLVHKPGCLLTQQERNDGLGAAAYLGDVQETKRLTEQQGAQLTSEVLVKAAGSVTDTVGRDLILQHLAQQPHFAEIAREVLVQSCYSEHISSSMRAFFQEQIDKTVK